MSAATAVVREGEERMEVWPLMTRMVPEGPREGVVPETVMGKPPGRRVWPARVVPVGGMARGSWGW